MVVGSVTIAIVAATNAAVDAAVTTTRVTANDKWGFVPIAGGQQVMMIHIEEAP